MRKPETNTEKLGLHVGALILGVVYLTVLVALWSGLSAFPHAQHWVHEAMGFGALALLLVVTRTAVVRYWFRRK